jgi:siroheme synthase
MAALKRAAGTSVVQPGSLVVVGTGISGPGQTTPEAVACIRRADKLFYAVTDPTTEFWLRQLNPRATSLSPLYAIGKKRRITYAEMTEVIVSSVRAGLRVCAAFYGHPGVLVTAAHAAMRRVREAGGQARMFPGISADACLYADLGINPGEQGVQSYEATEFLLSRRHVDPTSNLLLWQVGVLGESRMRSGIVFRPRRKQVLADRLLKHYPATHRLVLYQAPSFAAERFTMRHVALERLPRTRVPPMATLYVPALARRRPDPQIARWYEEG